MYQINTDLHTHTIFSGHAYGTLEENIRAAAGQKLQAIAVTDHYSDHFNIGTDKDDNIFSRYGHFMNMNAVPKEWYGVRVLSGLEADIVDFDGHILGYDRQVRGKRVDEQVLSACEIRIASVHYFPHCRKGSVLDYTRMYCSVLENPLIQILGHIGRTNLPFELDTVINKAKEQDKIIEINEHSFDAIFAPEIKNNCRQIAERCAQAGVGIVVSSDAHCSYYVGRFDKALAMLEEIHFPEELIVNANFDRLQEKLNLR